VAFNKGDVSDSTSLGARVDEFISKAATLLEALALYPALSQSDFVVKYGAVHGFT